MARAVAIRAEARDLPLPDASVDLVMTSPPYFGLRQYTDGGEPLAGQVGGEATPREYLDNLLACTAEWLRVLKPGGSLFVNLADKYAQARGHGHWETRGDKGDEHGQRVTKFWADKGAEDFGLQPKSLMGLPWRYANRCVDELDLILRRDIIWSKPNGMPESVTDRCRSSHEYLFHLVKQPRYYSAVDEIRRPHARDWAPGGNGGNSYRALRKSDHRDWNMPECAPHALGALPGSVWEIAPEPLNLPGWLGIEHYAAFPTALVRPVVRGWSPPGICTACGQGRFPVADQVSREPNDRLAIMTRNRTTTATGTHVGSTLGYPAESAERAIVGYACACTPYKDREGPGGPSWHTAGQHAIGPSGRRHTAENYPERLPRRTYLLDGWTPPPTRSALVIDPFGGTGTTALVAVALGRDGISFDLSFDYCRAARWRTRDSGERAKARGQAKPPPAKRPQEHLYGDLTDELDALLEESS